MTLTFDTKKILIGGGAIAAAAVIGIGSQLTGFSGQQTSSLAATVDAPITATTSSESVDTTHTTPVAPVLININTASPEQLMMLHGIGAAKASAVVAYRKTTTFYQIEDIMKVKGIGQALFDSFKDDITVGDVAPPPAAAAQPATHTANVPANLPAPTPQAHVIIAAVMTGIKGNANDDYVELYNASDFAADLSGWSIKKKSSSGAMTTLVASSHFSGKTIPTDKHFLIASDGYAGPVTPDLSWPSSYSLASTNNGIMLYEKDSSLADSVSWTEIPDGKSYMRSSSDSSTFVVSENAPHNSTD